MPGMQATRIQMVLANGTVQDFTPQSVSHIWRAVQARQRLSDHCIVCCVIASAFSVLSAYFLSVQA